MKITPARLKNGLSLRRLGSALLVTALVQAFAVSTHAQTLMNRYSFASDASDSIGLQNGTAVNATIANGVTFNPSLTNSYVWLPPGLLTGFTGFTIETWYTPQSPLNNDARLWEYGDDGNPPGQPGPDNFYDISLYAYWNNAAFLVAWDSMAGDVGRTAAWTEAAPTAGVSHQAVLTYDGPSQTYTIYLDGALNDTGAYYNPGDNAYVLLMTRIPSSLTTISFWERASKAATPL